MNPDDDQILVANDDPEREEKIAEQVNRLRISREARRRVDDEEERTKSVGLPPVQWLSESEPDTKPPPYCIHQLMLPDTRTLLVGPKKGGKTTLIGNLIRSWVDDLPFLGHFKVDRPFGSAAYFNYELNEQQGTRWLFDQGISNQDQIAIAHLRGMRFSLMTKAGMQSAIDWLEATEASLWILDTFRRAYTGISSNDNDEVARFTEAIDYIAQQAKVSNVVLVHHFGQAQQEEGEERGWGAVELPAWPDAIWTLVKDKNERYFSAEGRDVSLSSQRLSYDPVTRHLDLVGGSRYEYQRDKNWQNIVRIVDENPGVNKTSLKALLGGTNKDNQQGKWVDSAIAAGLIRMQPKGAQMQTHFITDKGQHLLLTGLIESD